MVEENVWRGRYDATAVSRVLRAAICERDDVLTMCAHRVPPRYVVERGAVVTEVSLEKDRAGCNEVV